jgi:dTDP-4-dehydrorhamnose 3,5-epimerase
VIFEPTPIPGAFLVGLDRREDERGFFARAWCREEFASQGIDVQMVQASVSHTRLAGTLRGLHFARPPAREGKLVRCVRGRVFDVIVDLRPQSPTYLRHFPIALDCSGHDAIFVPHGVAHGHQTLVDDCELLYMMTEPYRPELADGVRYDDPAFGIRWPLPVTHIAERDRGYPDFDRLAHAPQCGQAAVR